MYKRGVVGRADNKHNTNTFRGGEGALIGTLYVCVYVCKCVLALTLARTGVLGAASMSMSMGVHETQQI